MLQANAFLDPQKIQLTSIDIEHNIWEDQSIVWSEKRSWYTSEFGSFDAEPGWSCTHLMYVNTSSR